MKKLSLLLAVLAFSTQAYSECTMLNALVYAPIESIQKISETECKVTLSWSGKWIFSPSYSCPLSVGEVSTGITTSCEGLEVGDYLSGVLYKDLATSKIIVY